MPAVNPSVWLLSQSFVDRTRAPRDQVQQPGAGFAFMVTGVVDHAGDHPFRRKAGVFPDVFVGAERSGAARSGAAQPVRVGEFGVG